MSSIRYITSLLTFYLKGEIAVDKDFVKFSEPNTIIGLIPLGAKKQNIPMNQISSTQTNFKLKLAKLLLGIIIAFISISLFSESFVAGLLLLVVAGNTIIVAFELV